MNRGHRIRERASAGRIGLLLLTLLLLLGAASSAKAQTCADYGGVLDGAAGTVAPSQLKIDTNCTFRNYPASNPLGTNISFLTQPGQTNQRWLVIFDNVVHTGQMACNSVAGHKIWFVNGSSTSIQQGCQNLLIPVEKIDKQNPAGQTTATIGVPFTYKLTIPVLFDPATGSVINSQGSVNDLHGITVWDDLNATGVDLTYLGHTVTWNNTGAPVPHTFSNVGGALTFDNFPIVAAGDQFTIEITVVLNNTPTNTPGTQFVNTAKWDFGRLIDGTFYEPLPGEWGISPPLTIAAPALVMTKTGPATLGLTLNLGQWGTFTLDARNDGLTDAWDVTLLDRLPDGPTGGMCDLTPQILSAQVFQSDGVTPVPGKGPLIPGTDFSVSYRSAPDCELTLTMLTPKAVIGPTERLIVTYRTQLDANTQNGVTLTNVAGATQWFNGDASNPARVAFNRTLTNGTVGVVDHEDAHTVTAELHGYFFEKTVEDLTTGASPATRAAAGDRLRYTLRLQATDVPLNGVSFQDDMGALNATPVFEPGSLAIVAASIPAGADTSNTDPNGGVHGTGVIDVRNLSVPAFGQVQIQFDITLAAGLADGTLVTNQAGLYNTIKIADSDDPNVNGQASPSVVGDEDPTRLVIEELVPPALGKANTQATATIGEEFRYRITVPSAPHPAPLYDVKILDDLSASAADLELVSVAKVAGSGSWTPTNTGSSTNLVIEDTGGGIDIPAGEQAVVEITVRLRDTAVNVAGLAFTNTAVYSYDLVDGNVASLRPGASGTTAPMTVVEPDLTMTKNGPASMTLGVPGSFTLDVQNSGTSTAFETTLTDQLPDGASGGMCDVAPTAISAQVFQSNGTTPVSPVLTQGTDYDVVFGPAPTCELTLSMRTAAASIAPGERLIVSYQALLDAGSQNGAALTNVAGATRWASLDASAPVRRTYTRLLTDGTVGTLDHEDAHTVTVALPAHLFEKTVMDVTSGAQPAVTAAPGDVLRYRLRLENTSSLPMPGLVFHDDLGSLNPTASFVPGSLRLVTVPAGADTSATDPFGGVNGTGVLDVRNLSLPGAGQIVIEFEVTLASTLAQASVVTNQSQLSVAGAPFAVSDDPNVNGPANPFVAGDEDPTRVGIAVPPADALRKDNVQPTATIGETFAYRITVPATPYAFPMYDVRITDDLSASAADLRFVGVTRISGSTAWTPVNTGTTSSLVIEDTATGIDIPAGEQVVIEVQVVLEDTPTNLAGLGFTNTADYSFDWTDGDPTSQLPGAQGTSPAMTVVEPLLTVQKGGPASMTIGTPGTFTLDVHNAGGADAWHVGLSDQLPDGPTGGMCDVPPAAVTAQVFDASGTNPVSPPLVQGTDFSVAFASAPSCLWTLDVLTPAGVIGPDEHLLVTYQAQLDPGSQNGVALTNVAGATTWFSTEGSNPATAGDQRTYTRTLTDGTVGVLDHEDAHTVVVDLPAYLFEKTVTNLTTGASPATTARPGDVLRYRLRLESQANAPITGLGFRDELDRLNAPAAFVPGTLQLVTVPAGADTSQTSATGGAQGTGLVDVRNLSLSGLGDVQVVEFDVTLAPVIANGTVVADQSELLAGGVSFGLSDDPNVNGPADPFVAGDEDPTEVVIQSAPVFRVQKVSAYVTGSPSVLLPGETLRYTLTVSNVGNADAVDAVLRDALPANTSYVPGSTTLNGAAVADGPGGTLPLATGIAIQGAASATPGALAADPSASGSDVATVVFDVVVDPSAVNGTVISNQGFVGSVQGGVTGQPSDDPRTSIPDDPTRDVVGSSPLLFASKSAALLVDLGSPGIVDPGDVLHYTIVVDNNGAVPATGVTLTDSVPANTTYVVDTTTLNGLGVGRPDGGVSPLLAGIPISSSDLTPPLPGPGQGTLTPGERAVVEFDLRVDAGVPGGTIISNQATVASDQLPNLPTDGDGNPATGPEPTLVVVGNGQQLSISKSVVVVGGGAALAGGRLEYVIRVVNIAAVAAQNVVVTDDLDAPIPGQLTLVAGSALLDGSTAGVGVSGSVVTANYAAAHGPLPPGGSLELRFQAVISPGLAVGTTITNVGTVTWNTPAQSANASVSIDVGGMPGVGILGGTVWHDADFDKALGGTERPLAGWHVELFRNGQSMGAVTTDAAGTWRMSGLPPNNVSGDQYLIRFTAPGAGPRTASLGNGSSPFTNGPQQISDVLVASGSNLQGLDLPIDPNGTVYGAIQRVPVAGAVLSLLGPSGAALPPSCFDDPVQQAQVTSSDGFYKFDLNFSDPACPSGGDYRIEVTPPGAGYTSGYSQLIPPLSAAGGTPFSVPACPGTASDAVPSTPLRCEAQPSELPPAPSVAARTSGTAYYVLLTLDDAQVPGSSQLFNNHIPVDPVLAGLVGITKTTPLTHVSRGDLVPYEITVSNDLGTGLTDLGVVDRIPTGFRYVAGSARIDGAPMEPAIAGGTLTWAGIGIGAAGSRTLQLLLAVGGGVSEGEYTNRAQAVSALTGAPVSQEATATVRVVSDPTFDCTDVTGKVFDDANRNGRQDPGEPGLAGVRMVTTRGLAVTTDAYGRYHITCATVPREGRGSNFVLKLDDRTLPTGYRMSTRQVQMQRATRGKALRFNFAASIHRVVGLDLADAVFAPDTSEMRAQWRPRIGLLLDQLAKAPATLRLSYIADLEGEALVEERLDAVESEIRQAWEERDAYPLTIEREVFWRRGGPVDAAGRSGEGR